MGNINYYSTIYYWKTYDYDAPSNASRDDDDDDDDDWWCERIEGCWWFQNIWRVLSHQ